jgi:hypothetical protein
MRELNVLDGRELVVRAVLGVCIVGVRENSSRRDMDVDVDAEEGVLECWNFRATERASSRLERDNSRLRFTYAASVKGVAGDLCRGWYGSEIVKRVWEWDSIGLEERGGVSGLGSGILLLCWSPTEGGVRGCASKSRTTMKSEMLGEGWLVD